ncbi:hypothetical protein [Mycobacterium avium]|uniref:hypothetical protein n=1 Tax=Mycobacterium avium TaxID=1764 RepID=UPI0008F53CD3|nr:hypothetical protein [Mycobacterium avium]QBZ39410.1 hypothetical protein KV38_26600 [Mycobacterium avium subsp. hominissuis]
MPAAEYELIQEPDATYGPLISRISAAAKSVKMSMYELVSPAAVNALIAAHLSVLYPTLLLWLNLGSPRLGVSRWVRVDGVCTG